MDYLRSTTSVAIVSTLVILVGLAAPGALRAADHGDTPLLRDVARHDARLVDLFAFVRGSDLVLALCSNPAIPPEVAEYRFPSDVEFRIMIDNDSDVSFEDADDALILGGTVERPDKIKEDVRFRITFDDEGAARLDARGLSREARGLAARQRAAGDADDDGGEEDDPGVILFTGLRDDAFIRAPRTGRNVAAIVIQVPLDRVMDGQSTLLLWATAKVAGIRGPSQEHIGRALRSQFPENDLMNSAHPSKHFKELGVPPDVMIFDVSLPAAFPNGRELTDDVVDLVGDPRVLGNDQPFPSENDRPFLIEFPYLAEPHPPLD